VSGIGLERIHTVLRHISGSAGRCHSVSTIESGKTSRCFVKGCLVDLYDTCRPLEFSYKDGSKSGFESCRACLWLKRLRERLAFLREKQCCGRTSATEWQSLRKPSETLLGIGSTPGTGGERRLLHISILTLLGCCFQESDCHDTNNRLSQTGSLLALVSPD
jgi:hypothetical protein